MSPFRSVNTPKAADPPSISEMPTTSPIPPERNDARGRATHQPPQPSPAQPPDPATDDALTPTRASFAATGMSGQRPLPSSPFPEFVATISELPTVTTPQRTSSQRSRKSRRASKDSADIDIDMDESGGENAGSAGDSGSGNETSTNKKKKTQRFYCTEYPPCNLSFTRSEHLARHIRKHTGERPFQCHCSRRFSRLDNLRQHAQTVHQNEDIPIDSPAAMGTRFQKQIRTDKMRQAPGGRSRASTAASGVPPGRGHQKSLSTSIISSNVSTILPSEGRRRPPAIVMPNDHRDPYSQESHQGLFDGQTRGPPSPGGYHTPTSSTFSTGTNSPGWGSTGGPSPTPLHSRSNSMYNTYGDRVPGRRLSQPSSSNPFTSPSRQWAQERNPPVSPYAQFSPFPANGSLLPSPTTPTSSQWSRRESISSVADDAYRRRTWHPDTRDFAGASRLSQVISTSQLGDSPVPPPLADRGHHDKEQPLRLPGIESFDPPQPPPTLADRQPSPMMIDSGSDIPRRRGVPMLSESREMSDHSDTSLNRGIMRLNIDQPVRDSATAWADEASQAVLAQADQVRVSHAPQGVRFEPEPVMDNDRQQPRTFGRHQHTVSAPINYYRDVPVRAGMGRLWETSRAPVFTIQERRERSSMVHPNMSEFQGFPARNDRPVVHQPSRVAAEHGRMEGGYQGGRYPEASYPEANYRDARRPEQPSRDDMRGLDALVAVATNEKFQDRDRSGGRSTTANPKATFEVYEVRR